jgi:hypothetical protein
MTLSACSLISGKQESLTIVRERNVSNALRIDGCYYWTDSLSGYTNIFIFFRNGIIENLGVIDANELAKTMNERIVDAPKKMAKVPWAWGLYAIKGDSIMTEKWYPVGGDYLPGIKYGVIVNDTTFRFTLFSNSDGTDPMAIDQTFHFLKLRSKPDSTNNFIPLN